MQTRSAPKRQGRPTGHLPHADLGEMAASLRREPGALVVDVRAVAPRRRHTCLVSHVVVFGHSHSGLSVRDVRRLPSGDADQALFVLTTGGLSAETWVYAHEGNGFDGLVDFFRAMAEAWRGWEGEQAWSSLESDLVLTAKHDGHVQLHIQIRDSSEWSADAELVIDAGEELSAVVIALSHLFGG